MHMIARAAAADASSTSAYVVTRSHPRQSSLISGLCLLTLSSAWLVTLNTSTSPLARTFSMVDSSIPRVIGALGLLPVCSLYLILIPHLLSTSFSLRELTTRYFHAMGNYLWQDYLGTGMRNATFHGNLEMVRFLTPQGRMNRHDLSSCLNIAATAGHSDIMRYLLQLGRVADTAAGELLYLSANSGSIECVELILAAGYQIPIYYIEEAVVLASERGFAGILRNLLQHLPLLRPTIFRQALDVAPHAFIRSILHPFSAPAQIETITIPDDPNYFFVDFQELKAFPKAYLNQIATRGWPNQIRLRGSIEFLAVDLGGLTKEFISALIQAIGAQQLIPMDSSRLPYLPLAAPLRQQELAALHLRQLGMVYQTIYHRNNHRTDKLLTGEFFNPQFFTVMALACHARLNRQEKLSEMALILQEILPPTYHLPLLIVRCPPTDAAYTSLIADYQQILGCATEQEARAAALEEVDQYRLAAEAFFSGLSASCQEMIAAARTQEELTALLAAIQGHAITPETLASGMILIADHAHLQIAFDWLLSKIRTSDALWRKKFVRTVTGTESLFNTVIRVRESSHEGIEIHTCFNLIELPRGMDLSPAGKEFFEQMIDAVLVNPTYNTR